MIDAHLHFWDPARLTYDWLRHVPAIAGRQGPEQWAEVDGVAGKAVFVQADCAPEQAIHEADWVDGLRHPTVEILGVVAFAPLETGARARPSVEALRERPLVRGIRRSVQNEAAGFITAPDHLDGLELCAGSDLTIDICARGHQLPELIEALTRLFDRAPRARVVLDHLGKPDIAVHGGDIEGGGWADNLRTLAAFPNLFAKVSGLTTQDDFASRRDEVFVPYIHHAIGCFGADRLMYGGDWPVVDLAGGQDRWRRIFQAATAGLTVPERRRIQGETAADFYRLPPAHQEMRP